MCFSILTKCPQEKGRSSDSALPRQGSGTQNLVNQYLWSQPTLFPALWVGHVAQDRVLSSHGVFALSLAAAILRYLKNDGRIHLVVFNNLQLADGRRHRILLRLSNLQRGSGSVELYLDCAQVDSVHNLPRAFSGLTQNPESVELRTFQRKPQVGTQEQFCKVENVLPWLKGLCWGKCTSSSMLALWFESLGELQNM